MVPRRQLGDTLSGSSVRDRIPLVFKDTSVDTLYYLLWTGLSISGPLCSTTEMLVLGQLYVPRHHSGQWAIARQWQARKMPPLFRLYKWRLATITHNWTLHFKSGSSPASQKLLYHLLYLWPVVLVAAPSNKYCSNATSVKNIVQFFLCRDWVQMATCFWWGKALRVRWADSRHPSGPNSIRTKQEIYIYEQVNGQCCISLAAILKALWSNELITNLSLRTCLLKGIITHQ